jgi:hypothetical protein
MRLRAASARLWPDSTTRTASCLNSSLYPPRFPFLIFVSLSLLHQLAKGYVLRGQAHGSPHRLRRHRQSALPGIPNGSRKLLVAPAPESPQKMNPPPARLRPGSPHSKQQTLPTIKRQHDSTRLSADGTLPAPILGIHAPHNRCAPALKSVTSAETLPSPSSRRPFPQQPLTRRHPFPFRLL